MTGHTSLTNKAVSLVSRHSPVVAERVSTVAIDADNRTDVAIPLGVGQAAARREYFDRAGFVAAPTLLVGGLGAIDRCCGVAQRGDALCRAGWLALTWRSDERRWRRLARMLFLTMHGIDSDHRAGQRKRAEQSLDRRDFIGLFVAVEMCQH